MFCVCAGRVFSRYFVASALLVKIDEEIITTRIAVVVSLMSLFMFSPRITVIREYFNGESGSI